MRSVCGGCAVALLSCLLIVGAVFAAGLSATVAGSPYCAATDSLPRWRFHGSGFHITLEIDFAYWMRHLEVELTMPSLFFVDQAEISHRYTVDCYTASDEGDDGASTQHEAVGDTEEDETEEPRDLTDVKPEYAPLEIVALQPDNIEAPVFAVNFTENKIGFALQRLLPAAPTSPLLYKRCSLVVPVHLRYAQVNQTSTFSLIKFLTHEDAYTQSCVDQVRLRWRSELCGAGTATSLPVAVPKVDRHCHVIPAGVLGDLKFVYGALMTLLVVAAAAVIVSV